MPASFCATVLPSAHAPHREAACLKKLTPCGGCADHQAFITEIMLRSFLLDSLFSLPSGGPRSASTISSDSSVTSYSTLALCALTALFAELFALVSLASLFALMPLALLFALVPLALLFALVQLPALAALFALAELPTLSSLELDDELEEELELELELLERFLRRERSMPEDCEDSMKK